MSTVSLHDVSYTGFTYMCPTDQAQRTWITKMAVTSDQS